MSCPRPRLGNGGPAMNKKQQSRKIILVQGISLSICQGLLILPMGQLVQLVFRK